jgi:hypothetical protein
MRKRPRDPVRLVDPCSEFLELLPRSVQLDTIAASPMMSPASTHRKGSCWMRGNAESERRGHMPEPALPSPVAFAETAAAELGIELLGPPGTLPS